VERRVAVLEAALAVIAERGLDDTRMVDIAERAGMSAGHVMYYFPTKSDLLMRALAWSEERFLAIATAAIEPLGSARERLWRLLELSVPRSPVDPAWILWLETWAHAPHDPEVARFQHSVERRWLTLLADVVRRGQRDGEFQPVDAHRFVMTLNALVDGLSIRMLGSGDLTRDELLQLCKAEAEMRLFADASARVPRRRRTPRRAPR
jgi:AcrR family transcriptional regulator